MRGGFETGGEILNIVKILEWVAGGFEEFIREYGIITLNSIEYEKVITADDTFQLYVYRPVHCPSNVSYGQEQRQILSFETKSLERLEMLSTTSTPALFNNSRKLAGYNGLRAGISKVEVNNSRRETESWSTQRTRHAVHHFRLPRATPSHTAYKSLVSVPTRKLRHHCFSHHIPSENVVRT